MPGRPHLQQRQRHRRLLLRICTVAVLVACKHDDDKPPDAKVTLDAAAPVDAPAISGLGQKCASSTECPANAPSCISYKLSTGPSPKYCTPLCLQGATMMTDAQGNLSTPTPPPDTAKCIAAYSGGAGASVACVVPIAWTPMDNPFKASTTYTNLSMGCVILCGTGNACPSGTSCINGGCFPT